MAERRDQRDPGPVPDDFEGYLLAQVDSKELHFPKAVLRPLEEEGHGVLGSVWTRWSSLLRRLPKVMLMPAFAYALVLALLVPAYLGVSRTRSPRAVADAPPVAPAAPSSVPTAVARPAELGTPRSFHLGGGQVRDDGPVMRVTIQASDDFVLLSFLAPIRSDPSVVYEATLADASGRAVASKRPLRSTDGQGSFTLVCPSGLLAQGDYVLSVSEVASAASAEAPYQFRFRVVRPAP